jgi:hypothetical protein
VLLYVGPLTDLLLLVCTFAEEGEEALIYHLDASVAPCPCRPEVPGWHLLPELWRQHLY